MFASGQRHGSKAALYERRNERAEIRVRLAERLALALAFEERDDARPRARHAQQRAREFGFAQYFQALVALVVANFELAVDGNPRGAHCLRIGVGIDEAQRDIGLRALIAADEVRDDRAQAALRPGIAHDFDRPVERLQKRDRFGAEACKSAIDSELRLAPFS